jgi:hypothetical protein
MGLGVFSFAVQGAAVKRQHEIAPFEIPWTVITYPDGIITLWSDGIQLESQALVNIYTAIYLNSSHVRRTIIRVRHVH